MKTKKPKKRYHSPEEIMREIDGCYDRMSRLTKQSLALESAAEELMTVPNMVEDAKYKRAQALKCRKAVFRILEKKLPRLKCKLAEMMTDPIPGFLPDRSVSA